MSTQPTSIPRTRRDFLRDSALAAAAVLIVPGALRGQVEPSAAGRKIRLGVAGGNFGSQFFWHEDPGCTVAAVTDLLPDRREHLMKVYRCTTSYPSLEAMVKDPHLDAIAVFTDGPKHFEHVSLVLAHGKHVISAVPAIMARTPAEGLDQAHQLLERVKQSGLTYMMAETTRWRQRDITVRRMYEAGKLGRIINCESDYFHPGLRSMYGSAQDPTWRYGLPPMFYPTHCTSHLTGITGERLVEVACDGWGNDDPICKKNFFSNNPFWNETAHFRTDRGTPFRVRVWWEAPVWHTEGASWFGTKATVTDNDVIWSRAATQAKDDAGFAYADAKDAPMEKTDWWKTDLLPAPLRHDSGHGGSHTFITHEFIDALINHRRPAVDIHEALAYTVPGIVAHQSALQGGEQLKIPQFDA